MWNLALIVKSSLAGILSLLLLPRVSIAQESDAEVVERVVTNYLVSYCIAADFCRDAIRLEYLGKGSIRVSPLASTVVEGGQVRGYRARATALSHGPEYLVAVKNGHAWVLGGASSADVIGFVRETGLRTSAFDDPSGITRSLVILLDPFGARGIVGLDETPLAGTVENVVFLDAVSHLRAHRGESIERDTSFTLTNGSTVVTVTVLSAGDRMDGVVWRPIRYDFVFDRQGYLVAWDRRIGDVLATDAR